MRQNQSPTFRVEDYPTEMSWIGKLFVNLNPLIQSVNNVLNGNIDFSTNIKAVTQSFSVNPFQAFSFNWPFTDVPPQDVRVIKASSGTAQTPTSLQLAWSYDSSSRVISITNMLELKSSGVSQLSGSYQFTIRAQV